MEGGKRRLFQTLLINVMDHLICSVVCVWFFFFLITTTFFLSGNPRPPRFQSDSIGYRAHVYNVSWTTDSFAPITEYRLLYRRSDVSWGGGLSPTGLLKRFLKANRNRRRRTPDVTFKLTIVTNSALSM